MSPPPRIVQSAAKLITLALLGWLITGCSTPPPAQLRVDLGKGDQQRLLLYYFGSYTNNNPFESRLLSEDENGYWVDVPAWASVLPEDTPPPPDSNNDGVLDWDELEDFLAATYYMTRNLPPSLDVFQEAYSYQDTSNWMRVEIEGGVMTAARRHIYASRESIRAALNQYTGTKDRVIYPANTAFIGEHWLGNERVETTVSIKRPDGFWDYAVYDANGALVTATQTDPRPLTTPTRCVGCHFGEKIFEPEASFPQSAQPGPHGPRSIILPFSMEDQILVNLLDEHEKRSDTVLGPYASIFLEEIRLQGDEASKQDAELLQHVLNAH